MKKTRKIMSILMLSILLLTVTMLPASANNQMVKYENMKGLKEISTYMNKNLKDEESFDSLNVFSWLGFLDFICIAIMCTFANILRNLEYRFYWILENVFGCDISGFP